MSADKQWCWLLGVLLPPTTPHATGQVAAAAQVAQFLGADWRDVVPVVNATSAINAVANSLQLGPGDLLLMNNATYPAVSDAGTCSPARWMHGCCAAVDVAMVADICVADQQTCMSPHMLPPSVWVAAALILCCCPYCMCSQTCLGACRCRSSPPWQLQPSAPGRSCWSWWGTQPAGR